MPGKVVIDLNNRNIGRWGRLLNKLTPTRGARATSHFISGLCAEKPSKILVDRFGLRFHPEGSSRNWPVLSSDAYGRGLHRAGVKEVEVPAGSTPKQVKGILDSLMGQTVVCASKGGLDIEVEVNIDKLAEGLRLIGPVRAKTVIRELAEGKIMPSTVAKRIFRSVIDCSAAETIYHSGKGHYEAGRGSIGAGAGYSYVEEEPGWSEEILPESVEIDQPMLAKYKRLFKEMPASERKIFGPAVADQLRNLARSIQTRSNRLKDAVETVIRNMGLI